MTEETRESYDSGEVVWVKLGSSWWPGEVKNADELPSEVLDFKKAPLVIVKFFDEDSYEYVKTWVNIYPYNCEKKNEFIKKGMAAFRAKVPHMEKFPKDVLKAEEKLGGNINILSDPMFLPEKKRNYAAEVFGTPSPKSSTPKNKRRSNKSGGKKDTSHITHRRFLGADDYRAYICIQYPGKDRIPGDREDEEVLRINREPEQDFNCHSCNFSTKRLEVMILHTKSHIKGFYLSSAWKNKQSSSRRRKEKSRKKKRGSDTLESDSNSSDSEPVRQKKRKPRSQGTRKKKARTEEEGEASSAATEPQPPKKDIRSELLEAWEDSEEDEDLNLSFNQINESLNRTGDGSSSEAVLDDSQKKSLTVDESNETDLNDSKQSEEAPSKSDQKDRDVRKIPSPTIEEALNEVAGEMDGSNSQNDLVKSVGEQLSTEKLLSTLEDDSMDVADKTNKTEEEEIPEEKTEAVVKEKDDEVEEEIAQKSDTDEDPSKQKMGKDIHEAIKSCFDFDEDDEVDNAIVSKAATGRKIPRVIPKKSAKKSPEEAETILDKTEKEKEDHEDMDSAFKELMEMTSVPDLPDVQNTLKCEQNFHNIKTIKFPDKPERVGSPPKVERKDSTEVATKLTNPKKRFVKSFEDFELMQNEIRRREEEQLEAPKNDKLEDNTDTKQNKEESDSSDDQDSPDSNIKLSKLKSKIMSKIIEEAKINPESKNRIMAKIQEPKPPKNVELPVTAESEAKVSSNSHEKAKEKVSSSHRTPRSKILESYRKDTKKRMVEEEKETVQVDAGRSEGGSSNTDDRLKASQPDKDVVPPVRKKWSRRGSHPKKDRNLFMLQDISPTEPPSVEVTSNKTLELAKNEEQTILEPEQVTDPAKINDIIMGDLKPSTPVDVVSPNEIVEEETVETTAKEMGDVVSKPIEEEEEKKGGGQELSLKEVTVEDDTKLPSVEPNVIDSKEVFEKNEPLVEVGETEAVENLGESVQETNYEEVPPTVVETQVPVEVPPVEEEEEVPVTDEASKPSVEQDVEVSEAKEIPAKEEDKEVPLLNIEVATIVPLSETKTFDAEKSGLETTEIVEKHIVEEPSVVTSPGIDSHTSPPREVITVPFKKSKKRKISEGEFDFNPPAPPLRFNMAEEFKLDDFGPSDKRKKDADVTEEEIKEIKLPSPSPVNIDSGHVEKDGLEDAMEVEQSTEVPENDVRNKDNVEESQQVEKIKEVNESQEVEKIENKESSSENKESLEEVGEESVNQDPVEVIESEKVSEEGKGGDDKVETDKVETNEVEVDKVETNEVEVDKVEIGKVETNKVETDKGEVYNVEADKVEVDKVETDKVEINEVEVDNVEADKVEIDKVEADKAETDQVENDEVEADRAETDKVEVDKVEVDKAETNKGEINKVEIDKMETDKTEPDSKIIEIEKAAVTEQSKDTECNKETDPSESEHINEVEIQCASSSVDSFKFSIQTNLSILSSREEMSALALATLSEIKADLESNEDIIPKEKEKKPTLLESEMVPIEGNLTVMSEKDLADGQVEITSEQVFSSKRPITLSSFSMDFSDSLSDSNSNSTTDTSSDISKCDFNSKGTEFTQKALTKQMKKVDQKKESTYGRLELINILEGNSDSERKSREYVHPPPKKSSVVDDICDFEEHIPSQIVCAKSLKPVPMDLEPDHKEFKEKSSKTSVKSTTSKLLERLTTESKAKASAAKTSTPSDITGYETVGKMPAKVQATPPAPPKSTKYGAKSKSAGKPIILSEQILKPATDTLKMKPKKPMEDIEDVEAFVIHKDPNKGFEEEGTPKAKSVSTKMSGKAKILQQTIITPAGEIIQPTVTEAQADDNIFDINSMPIVLSDEILTPESIEKMPIVIGSDTPKAAVPENVVKRPGRLITTVASPQVTPNKTITITKHKPPRILQSFGNKAKNSPLLPNTAKPGKYIIVPQSSIPPTTKYTPKKPAIVKKTPASTGIVQKVPNIAPEPSGNKIMIVTNQQGQQQRLLLTPAQQKMLGYQNQKVTKTIVKGNVMQKSVLATKSMPLAEAGTSGIASKTSSLIGQKLVLGVSPGQGLITTTGHQVVGPPGRITKTVTKRSPANAQKLAASASKPQKTILIKNQHGQTVRKIQGTDDELLDKQVAEQLEAIKASSGMKFSSQQKATEAGKATPKTSVRRIYTKRAEVKMRGPPPLAGIQQSPKPETVVAMPALKKPEPMETKPTPVLEEPSKTQATDRPRNQLVIQDAVGNQTTITEGQILALPSETVDGQPQSYMLVTLDESGNLTPLNSEALMSLDPNLGLGGDLSNMVLQIDQSALSDRPQQAVIKPPEIVESVKPVEVECPPQQVPEPSVMTEITETAVEQKIIPTTETLQAVPASTNGDPGQQLIVTGDPIATQKFLESLTEGTTDLANILANAEGNSILIQADGQQILINTNTDNQMLLSMNNDSVNVTENTEGGGNPIFATQPSKNQDILAAALADTDVFQQEHPSSVQSKIVSQLSPNNTLYPMNVGNVLETSLTLSSPIMTPLEVPSTNNKKIPDDEADILTQVPKNVDLPITITDPNISQTVANQQVSAMIANELQTNLELALPISETTISTVSTEMNSPSYVYSLPTLDDSVEIAQKPFNGSMPLLNEDVEESMNKAKTEDEDKISREKSPTDKSKVEMTSDGFLAEEEGRFTLGGEMCSSLSEPPPEMFDLPEMSQNFSEKAPSNIPSLQSTPDVSDNASKDEDTTDLSHADTSSEGSCEIPLQPPIVAKSLDLSRNLDSLKRSLGEAAAAAGEGESKKCKFD